MIVSRNVPTIRELRIIVKLHLRKHFHNVAEPIHRHRFPAKVTRAIETENRNHIFLFSLLNRQGDILHQVSHKLFTIIEEAHRLADTGPLDIVSRLTTLEHSTTPCRIETDSGAPIRSHRAGIVTRKPARGEVKNEAQVTFLLTLHQFRIASGQQLHFVYLPLGYD